MKLCNRCSVFSCSDDVDVLSLTVIKFLLASAAASRARGYLQTPVHAGDLNCDARSQVQCSPFEPYNL